MKRTIIGPLIILLAFCVHIAAQSKPSATATVYDAALAKKLGADEYGMRSYVYVLLRTGKASITDKEERNKIFAGHFENMGRLSDEGKLVMAGPFDDPNGVMRGMYVFDVATTEEAKTLVETDPAVKAGIFDYELTKLYSSAALKMISEVHKKIQKTAIN